MQINAYNLHAAIFVVLLSSTLASETSENLTDNVIEDDPGVPSRRLATALPRLKEQGWDSTEVPSELNRQGRAARLVPREAPDPIPELPGVGNDIPLVFTLPPESAFINKNDPVPIANNINETEQQALVPSPQAQNKSKEFVKTLADTTREVAKATLSTDKPLNHSSDVLADASGQGSQLLLSVQAASASYGPSNMSGIEGTSNVTGNQSAVLITNTHEIEVVIIAEGPPDVAAAPLVAPSTELPLIPEANDAPSRRFPSGLVYPNGTFVGGPLPVTPMYPSHHYWAVYLTLTLLTLSVLAICLVCCTPQGRRDMSIPPPKPVQYGHQLPPYSYAFSYDMRQVDAQETERLNPASHP